jgi:hypothetical protein
MSPWDLQINVFANIILRYVKNNAALEKGR